MKWSVAFFLPWGTLAVLKSRTPTGQPVSEPSKSVWKDFTDPSGRHFRLNLETGATVWEDELVHPSGQVAPRRETTVAPTTHAPSGPSAYAPTQPAPSTAHHTAARSLESAAPVRASEQEEANMAGAAGTPWFAKHGWLDDWLGWGDSAADPVSQEVREEVAEDLGLRAPEPPSMRSIGDKGSNSSVQAAAGIPSKAGQISRTKPVVKSAPVQATAGREALEVLYKQAAANLPTRTPLAQVPQAKAPLTKGGDPRPEPKGQDAAQSSQRSRALRDVAWAAARKRVQSVEDDVGRMLKEREHMQKAARNAASYKMSVGRRMGTHEAQAARAAALRSLRDDELVRKGKELLERITQEPGSTINEPPSSDKEEFGTAASQLYKQQRGAAWDAIQKQLHAAQAAARARQIALATETSRILARTDASEDLEAKVLDQTPSEQEAILSGQVLVEQEEMARVRDVLEHKAVA